MDLRPQRLMEEPGEPDSHDQDQDSDLSPAERDARDATELARLRRQYSHVSSHHLQGSSTAARKPTSILGRFRYSLSNFWKHQVSIVVPHNTCRDHLGMSISIPPSFQYPEDRIDTMYIPHLAIGVCYPKLCPCTMSSGILHNLVSQSRLSIKQIDFCQALMNLNSSTVMRRHRVTYFMIEFD
jgi:hypothetical protein